MTIWTSLIRTLLTKGKTYFSELKYKSWTSSCWRAKVGRPARTYIQQLCADKGSSLEDIPGAMDDRDGWREKGQGDPCWRRDMIFIYIYIYIHTHKRIYIYEFTNPSTQAGSKKTSMFLAGFIRIVFKVFLLLDWLPYKLKELSLSNY